MTDALTKLSNANTMLAEANTVLDALEVRDIATAARAYAKAAQLGIEATNKAAEIKIRAERRAGEMLAQLEKDKPGPKELDRTMRSNSEYRQTLIDTNTNKDQAARWQQIATIPEPVFEQHIAETMAERQELTTAGVMRLKQKIEREDRASGKNQPPPIDGAYRVWYADPPWSYGNSGVITDTDAYGRASRHYPTMSIAELCNMGEEIKAASEDNAVLFMWVTSPLLAECFPVIDAWGFKYKTSFVWDKVGHNFGHYNSVRHELLLVCTKGSCLPDIPTLYDSVQSIPKSNKHSEKPEEFRQIIDALYPTGNRIELFARVAVDGWDAWGNE